jgi:hypothetical protein
MNRREFLAAACFSAASILPPATGFAAAADVQVTVLDTKTYEETQTALF